MPDWYRMPMNFYNSNEYIADVGEGHNFEEAANQAKARLIQQISVDIETYATNSMIDVLTERDGAFRFQTIRETQSRAEHQVVGMRYLFQEEKDGVFYVMLGVNKSRMLRRIEAENEEVTNRIINMMRSAEVFIEGNDIVSALDTYHEAIKELNTLIQNKIFTDAFSDRVLHIREEISYSRIRNRAMALINTISFEVISTESEPTIRNNRLSEPVIFKASFISAGGDSNVRGLPVVIRFSDGRVIETGVTNRNGEYRISTISETFKENREMIIISIDSKSYPFFEEGFFNNNRAEKIVARVPFRVQLRVTDKDGNIHQSAQTRLSTFLSQNSIEQTSNAPIMVAADVSWSSSQHGNFTEVTTHMNVNILIVQTGQVLGSVQLRSMGTSPRGETDALNIALRNMNTNSLFHLMHRIRYEF